MKKVAVILGILGLGVIGWAEDVTITVTIAQITIQVSPTTVALGVVSAGSRTVSSGVTVTNNGNVAVNYRLQLTGVPNGWTYAQVSSGQDLEENSFVMGAKFASSAPALTDFNIAGDADTGFNGPDFLETAQVTCNGTRFATDGDNDGYQVAAGASQTLYFRFDAPPSTNVTTQQSIVVSITAVSAQ
jgi:hypothetical protein